MRCWRLFNTVYKQTHTYTYIYTHTNSLPRLRLLEVWLRNVVVVVFPQTLLGVVQMPTHLTTNHVSH